MMSTSCNCSYVLLGEKILLDVKVWLDELDLEGVIAESLKEFGDVDKLRNTQAPLLVLEIKTHTLRDFYAKSSCSQMYVLGFYLIVLSPIFFCLAFKVKSGREGFFCCRIIKLVRDGRRAVITQGPWLQ